jgi:hypothetical protein
MATITPVNSVHERTTESNISFEVITTQNEDSTTQKTSTGSRSRHIEQPHNTTVLEEGTSARRENRDEFYASSMATQHQGHRALKTLTNQQTALVDVGAL